MAEGYATTFEDHAIPLVARVRASDEGYVTQSDLSSIAYKTFDADDLTTTVASGTLVVADTIYDTLQTTLSIPDSTGYNLKFDAPGTLFPTGGKIVIVEVVLTETGGATIMVRWNVTVKEVHGS